MKRFLPYVLAVGVGVAVGFFLSPKAVPADVGNLKADYEECIVREGTLQLQLDNLKARDEYRRDGFARP